MLIPKQATSSVSVRLGQRAHDRTEEWIELKWKVDPPPIEVLELTRKNPTEFAYQQREVVVRLVPPAPIEYHHRQILRWPSDSDTKWLVLMLPWRVNEDDELRL
ncbi:hypothetical protein QOT17_007880 [Balamuthia mandrillaris]